jgi:hypothetical protein
MSIQGGNFGSASAAQTAVSSALGANTTLDGFSVLSNTVASAGYSDTSQSSPNLGLILGLTIPLGLACNHSFIQSSPSSLLLSIRRARTRILQLTLQEKREYPSIPMTTTTRITFKNTYDDIYSISNAIPKYHPFFIHISHFYLKGGWTRMNR